LRQSDTQYIGHLSLLFNCDSLDSCWAGEAAGGGGSVEAQHTGGAYTLLPAAVGIEIRLLRVNLALIVLKPLHPPAAVVSREE
jgi:hypothetical protein